MVKMEQGQTPYVKRSLTRRNALCFSMSSNVVGNMGHNGFPRLTTGIRRTWILLDEVAVSLADLSLSAFHPQEDALIRNRGRFLSPWAVLL